MVKKAYELPEEITYPLVVVQEIENTENLKFSTTKGEQVTNLAYQIDAYCDTTQLSTGEILNAGDSAKLLGNKISKLLGGEKYKMARVGNDPTVPIGPDSTIMRNVQRYNCCLHKNIIYRR